MRKQQVAETRFDRNKLLRKTDETSLSDLATQHVVGTDRVRLAQEKRLRKGQKRKSEWNQLVRH